MRGVNVVILVGNVGRDPEVRSTRNGTEVATLSIATSESWMKDGNRQEKTEWHRVVAWGKLAGVVGKYTSKGRQVYVQGRIQSRTWDDKDGNKRYTTEIVANQIVLLGGKQEAAAGKDVAEMIFNGEEVPKEFEGKGEF